MHEKSECRSRWAAARGLPAPVPWEGLHTVLGGPHLTPATRDYFSLLHSMHYARIGRADASGRPRRKSHDFGDLGRALEMVALLPGVALGG